LSVKLDFYGADIQDHDEVKEDSYDEDEGAEFPKRRHRFNGRKDSNQGENNEGVDNATESLNVTLKRFQSMIKQVE
jgi:hypothetical protein